MLCESGATAVQYTDGGPETLSLTSDGGCAGVAVHPSGHCARTELLLPAQRCTPDMLGCRAPCGLSSNDLQLWRTVAHEVGLNLTLTPTPTLTLALL